jgi:hypothetical protein
MNFVAGIGGELSCEFLLQAFFWEDFPVLRAGEKRSKSAGFPEGGGQGRTASGIDSQVGVFHAGKI